MFEFWDWVGGRYSLWSAIGLSIAVAIGFDNFEELLTGGHAMDEHFRSTPYEKNLPVILALMGIWYNDFFGARPKRSCPTISTCIVSPLISSKGIWNPTASPSSATANPATTRPGPIIWGEPGTNGQHAFYQLIHQGTKLVPCDFLARSKPTILLANIMRSCSPTFLPKPRR